MTDIISIHRSLSILEILLLYSLCLFVCCDFLAFTLTFSGLFCRHNVDLAFIFSWLRK